MRTQPFGDAAKVITDSDRSAFHEHAESGPTGRRTPTASRQAMAMARAVAARTPR